MEKSLPPSEAKLESLRQQGIVARSPTAIRLAAGAGALVCTVFLLRLSDFLRFYGECTAFDASCQAPLQKLIRYGIQLTVASAIVYVVVGAGATLLLSRFYIRVASSVGFQRSLMRRSARFLFCVGLGACVSAIVVLYLLPTLFGLFNITTGSGYTAYSESIAVYLRSVSRLWALGGLIGAIIIGAVARVLFFAEHAMSKEEVLMENRG